MVAELRRQGVRSIAYVDDFGGAPPAPPGVPATRVQAVAAFQFVATLLSHLGVLFHPAKGTRDGPQQMQLLGHVINSRDGIYQLPTERVGNTVAQAVALTRYAAAHQWWVGFKALRRFCDTAVSSTLSGLGARLHLRRLFHVLQFRHPISRNAWLGHEALTDLNLWVNLAAHAAGGRPIRPGTANLLLDTDASGVGSGADLRSLLEARGVFGSLRSGLHINVFELGEITLALRAFRDAVFASTIIRPRTDSMVALGVLRGQSFHYLVLMDEYRSLHALCRNMGVEVRAEHLSSAFNAWGDRLSRERDTTDWTLRDASFSKLAAEYGQLTVERFDSYLNARCPGFYTRWAAPGGLGVDALAHCWQCENSSASPQFHVVGLVVHDILAECAAATLVAPEWRAQPWWSRAVEAASEWWVLPLADGVYTYATRSTPTPRLQWRTVVFHFSAVAACATTPSAGPSSFLA